jgi:hypothetical protein
MYFSCDFAGIKILLAAFAAISMTEETLSRVHHLHFSGDRSVTKVKSGCNLPHWFM